MIRVIRGDKGDKGDKGDREDKGDKGDKQRQFTHQCRHHGNPPDIYEIRRKSMPDPWKSSRDP